MKCLIDNRVVEVNPAHCYGRVKVGSKALLLEDAGSPMLFEDFGYVRRKETEDGLARAGWSDDPTLTVDYSSYVKEAVVIEI